MYTSHFFFMQEYTEHLNQKYLDVAVQQNSELSKQISFSQEKVMFCVCSILYIYICTTAFANRFTRKILYSNFIIIVIIFTHCMICYNLLTFMGIQLNCSYLCNTQLVYVLYVLYVQYIVMIQYSLYVSVLYFAWEDQGDAIYCIFHTVLISCISVSCTAIIGQMQYSYALNWANTEHLGMENLRNVNLHKHSCKHHIVNR